MIVYGVQTGLCTGMLHLDMMGCDMHSGEKRTYRYVSMFSLYIFGGGGLERKAVYR